MWKPKGCCLNCGDTEYEKRNKEYMLDTTEKPAKKILCVFDAYCVECGKYMFHYEYGHIEE